MQRRTFIRKTGAAGLITFIAPHSIAKALTKDEDTLFEKKFSSPPSSAYPQTYWPWMNGNVSKEGITLDLEAMKRIGIAGVFNFDVGTGIPKGPVEYLSEEWFALKKHTIKECERLGLEFTMHNCPGWSASGGPWITPDLAMQQITWSEIYIAGDQQINISLPKPFSRLNHYKDIAVLAFPSLEFESHLQTFYATSRDESIDRKKITGEDPDGVIVYPAGDKTEAYLQLEFNKPYNAKSITFFISAIQTGRPAKQNDFGKRTSIVLEASNDGIHFHLITTINTGLESELLLGDKFITYDFPLTIAKFFRLTSSEARRYRQVRFSGITRLNNWMEKTNNRPMFAYPGEASILSDNEEVFPLDSIVDIDKIHDISQYMQQNGILNWNAPSGNWTILRMGYTSTGMLNKAAPDAGIGLECDKYNKAAFDFHFNKMMEQILPLIKQLAVNEKIALEIDSYEAGLQNWTPSFEEQFQKRWKYNLIKYLPAITGRVLGSIDITERFLWDFRRLQADLIANNYYGRFHELCHQHGMISFIEPYDQGPMEEMQIGSRGDINVCEYWNGLSTIVPGNPSFRRTAKLVSSIAHINDQKIAAVEAFTAEPGSSAWQEYPFAMKATGDKIFTKGINRIIFHRFAHQPHPSASPGMTMGPWGVHFDRTNTWWEEGKDWITYLARCQYMLQQGIYIADLAYFSGEDANMYTKTNAEDLYPPPPRGFNYDLINAEIILNKIKIEDNKIVLPNEMRYSILILQNFKAISIELLQKLYDLVLEGMIIVGAKPERSTGLGNYKNSDADFKKIVNKLWGHIDGNSITENRLGKGYVFWGDSLSAILNKFFIHPDFEISSRSGDAPVIFTHYKNADTDIYFLSNQRRTYEETICTFRIKNKQPELWDAVTGKITAVPVYDSVNDTMRLPVLLQPYGSVFIVFRSNLSLQHIQSVEKNNKIILDTNPFHFSNKALYKNVSQNFTISIWAKPEINAMLSPAFVPGSKKDPWTEYYAVYPSPGKHLYGKDHALAGLTIGRNGVAVWENESGAPSFIFAAFEAISGWAHIAVVYKNAVPSIYINGSFIAKGKRSSYIIHPGTGHAFLDKGASFYNGDMNTPVVFAEALNEENIKALSKGNIHHFQASPFIVQIANMGNPGLMIRENGSYVLRKNNADISAFSISGIDEPVKIEGPWSVQFPPGFGAPAKIVLPQLISLHKHNDAGVRYFSGSAVYSTIFTNPVRNITANTHFFLDLGNVEVIAEVTVNNIYFGILWTRPYSVNITRALKSGVNTLEVKITNLWPNRLIGDEQIANPDKFTPGGETSGLESLINGGIEKLPEWYLNGKQKPANGRVTFTTWKHYTKDSPLAQSGLIGPVTLQMMLFKPL